MGGKEGGKNEKNTLWKTCFLSWFAHTGLYGINVGAREEAKTKKPRFRKCGFFVVCPYGLNATPVGRKEGGKKEKRKKTHFVKRCFCCGLPIRASMASMWGYGRRQKRKNHVLESMVFSWFAHRGLYATPEEGGKKEKNTLCKTCFFRGLPIRASMASIGGTGRGKNEKTTF